MENQGENAGRKECPKCGYGLEENQEECPVCGIVIERYLEMYPQAGASQPPPPPGMASSSAPGATHKTYYSSGSAFFGSIFLARLLTPLEKNCNPFIIAGHALVILILLLISFGLWTAPIESNKAGESFLHLINLPFHEAGHIFFRPFGEFITSLGGTLGQFMVPLICLGAFLFYKFDNFAAAVCLWWTGENFLDIAPYVNDARDLVLPLIGGNTGQTSPYGFHDWEFILTESGLIGYEHDIARACQFIGTIIMALALIWAVFLVWKQFQMLRNAGAVS